LESGHNVVSLSDVGELPCIDVERENTSDVGCNCFGTGFSYERPDHLSGSFFHPDGDGVPQRSGTEGQIEVTWRGAFVPGRSEALEESDARRQGERSRVPDFKCPPIRMRDTARPISHES
jgi:hypothetical protein